MFYCSPFKAKQALISVALSSALLLVPGLAQASTLAHPIVVAQAETPPATPPNAMMQQHREHMMAMLKQLNLTDAQWEKIKALDASFRAAHPKGSPPDRKAAKAHHKALMAILTPTQRENLRHMMKMEKLHHGHDGGEGMGPGDDASSAPNGNGMNGH